MGHAGKNEIVSIKNIRTMEDFDNCVDIITTITFNQCSIVGHQEA